MSEHPAAGSGGQGGHLDATGPREVVYCHQCDNEWFQDTHGLICPRCEGDVTEIVGSSEDYISTHVLTSPQVDPNSDPRPPLQRPSTPPDLDSLRNHNPWGDNGQDSDPEEADIEEHVQHGPNGIVFTHTVRRSTPLYGNGRRNNRPETNTPDVMRNFQTMLGNLMGPQYQPGQAGRSGPDTLFSPFPPNFQGGGFQMGGGEGQGPRIVGGRFTFTTGGQTRDAGGPERLGPPFEDLATYDPHPNITGRPIVIIDIRADPENLSRVIGSIFGPMAGAGGPGENNQGAQGGPPGLAGLFAQLLNPANARAGDAVYSQEALDQIISTLMEQHPTSNAPGPAAAESIAALPKKKLDEQLLGPEGKGECSVCMDDVHIGDEVVSLPCSHWFHETCASAWLSEHNTCPICRKGIDSQTPPPNSRRASQSTPNSRNEHRARRLSTTRPRLSRDNTSSSAQDRQSRLDAIRNAGGRLAPSPEEEPSPGRQFRWHVVGNSNNYSQEHPTQMPGSYNFRRASTYSSGHRDGRRENTSGSDHSRGSRRSSQSGSGVGGALSWLRDRFGGSGNRRQD